MMITEDEIDDKICELMHMFGPDGHIDGHDKITEYIMSLLESVIKERDQAA